MEDTSKTTIPRWSKEKKRRIFLLMVALILLLVILLIQFRSCYLTDVPTLSVASPERLNAGYRDEFVVDIVLSDLGDQVYPAASLIATFDKNKLTFTGVKQGTMLIYEEFNPLEDRQTEEPSMISPVWSANEEYSNRTGEIHAMYLDMTGGWNAYSGEVFEKDKTDVVLRLGFRLKDSVVSNEELAITLKEAVFAVSGGDISGESLSSLKEYNTLRLQDGKICIE